MRTAKPCPNRRCQSRAKTKGMNRYEHLVPSWNDGCRWLLHVAGSSSPGPVAPSFFEFSATVRMSSMAARNAAISSVSFGTSLMKNMEINWQDSSLIWANYQSIIKSHITPIHVVQLSINIMQDPCSSCSNEVSISRAGTPTKVPLVVWWKKQCPAGPQAMAVWYALNIHKVSHLLHGDDHASLFDTIICIYIYVYSYK